MRFYTHVQKFYVHEQILLLEDRHIVKISYPSHIKDFFKQITEVIHDYVTSVKRDDWLREILRNHYYYQDVEEQQQILNILYSILDGQRKDLEIFLQETNLDDLIRDAINHVVQENSSFSFDSFVKFRLRPYLRLLENYIQVSIDEYKLEQEYQIFIQMLRDFLIGQESKLPLLHLQLDEKITFYNDELVEIKRRELTKMIDRKLLVNHPVYIDSATIAPLLSLAPTKVYLYTKNPDALLVRTIRTIFEERVELRSEATLTEMLNKKVTCHSLDVSRKLLQ